MWFKGVLNDFHLQYLELKELERRQSLIPTQIHGTKYQTYWDSFKLNN